MEDQKMKKPKDSKYNNSPEYNKAYYLKHKAAILNALKTKCKCDECGRVVSYSRLRKHKETDICMRNTNLLSQALVLALVFVARNINLILCWQSSTVSNKKEFILITM